MQRSSTSRGPTAGRCVLYLVLLRLCASLQRPTPSSLQLTGSGPVKRRECESLNWDAAVGLWGSASLLWVLKFY